jgi:hypothetical protein
MNLFAAGYLMGRAAPTTANPNPSPRMFGQLQEVSMDDSFEEKKLFGANSAPLRVFRGQRKLDIKAKAARISGAAYCELFYGTTTSTGSVLSVFNEVQTIPATTTYTLTANNAGVAGANFVEDYGVAYATTGVDFKLVVGTPTVGQYSVSSVGVYTFAAADASAVVVLRYGYSVLTGITVQVPNTAQQESPYFSAVLNNPTDGGFTRKIFKCTASKLNMQFKQGEIVIPEFDISVVDPGTSVLYVDYYAQA